MKKFDIKKKAAFILAACAMLTAATASGLCIFYILGEPEMPKSLYKID